MTLVRNDDKLSLLLLLTTKQKNEVIPHIKLINYNISISYNVCQLEI